MNAFFKDFFVKPLLALAIALPAVATVHIEDADAHHRKKRAAAFIAGAIIGGAIIHHNRKRKQKRYYHDHKVRHHHHRTYRHRHCHGCPSHYHEY